MSEVKKIATRESYGNALVELGKKYDDVVVLDADLAAATKTGIFKKAFPERHIDCGIAECNMIGVAAGLIAAWFGLIIGFGATAAALILVLIALVVAGIISLFTHPFVGMGLIGAGLICGGVGLLFLMLTVAMAGIATPAICCWIGGLFQKRGKAEA